MLREREREISWKCITRNGSIFQSTAVSRHEFKRVLLDVPTSGWRNASLHEGAVAATEGATEYQNEISEDNKYSVIAVNRVIVRYRNDEVALLATIHENIFDKTD